MGSRNLHVFFVPYIAHGHMIPMLDMARCFAERGVMATVITTSFHASSFQKTIDRDALNGHPIRLHTLRFPSSEAGLPDDCKSLEDVTSPALSSALWKALDMLQHPFEQLVSEHLPDCIVSDVFFPWTLEVARKHDIPRLFSNWSSFFSTCAMENVRRYKPHENIDSDTEMFVLPDFRDRIEMTRLQLPDFLKGTSIFDGLSDRIKEADKMSYGFLVNSFYELEPAYADYYKEEFGMKAWNVGPVSLCNREVVDKAERGKKASIKEDKCLRWLDSMKLSSVVYVCFGTFCNYVDSQLLEIALALEASDHPFIWVVKEHKSSSDEPWLPSGFEERMEGKGMIIRGWAPQVLILDHPSVGAFVTHCGWNSVLEGVTAGVPMITWPAFAEQFFNEKLVTDVLKVGAGVGVAEWVSFQQEEERPLVKREEIEMAVRRVMDSGDEADGMRKRAKEMGKMAKRAVEEGGSSYIDLSNLIEELKMYGLQRISHQE